MACATGVACVVNSPLCVVLFTVPRLPCWPVDPGEAGEDAQEGHGRFDPASLGRVCEERRCERSAVLCRRVGLSGSAWCLGEGSWGNHPRVGWERAKATTSCNSNKKAMLHGIGKPVGELEKNKRKRPIISEREEPVDRMEGRTDQVSGWSHAYL